MLVTFSTDAYANITMFGDAAVTMLKMMGHSATVPGAILAEDVPAALHQLTSTLISAKSPPEIENDDEPAPVSLAHRGRPLINLLTAASKAKCNVMWDKASPLD